MRTARWPRPPSGRGPTSSLSATYGNFNLTGSYTAADWVAEATDHGVNNCQLNMGMGMGTYLGSGSGAADAQSGVLATPLIPSPT